MHAARTAASLTHTTASKPRKQQHKKLGTDVEEARTHKDDDELTLSDKEAEGQTSLEVRRSNTDDVDVLAFRHRSNAAHPLSSRLAGSQDNACQASPWRTEATLPRRLGNRHKRRAKTTRAESQWSDRAQGARKYGRVAAAGQLRTPKDGRGNKGATVDSNGCRRPSGGATQGAKSH